ncbi:asparaginase [Komagataeibacter medellinensis]|uniref:L-asparaginase II n=1 Tax=Komagataeibacter medellinensis (strain NBRC 3288 / BCRC 11682 / LMG 1693 / Kondo 51) TaxID=634177 RepID=G2I610_KOMMN|nr:asparaginase [Komagataeibacter medellinensis]BAK83557.1 L-asparaginase II [Komagataeibacter medellinensis NBRC 3288]
MPRPVIAIISTGGTIARQAADPRDTVDYAEIGTNIDGDDLLEALPEGVRARFAVRGIAFSSCDSVEMTLPRWFELAGVINRTLLEQPNVDGVVVTHGTSSLEEAACFLDLVLDVSCPVVVVGAQRPASAISADGPANLFAALLVASAPQAAGRGVLVVANNEIHAAQEVTKASTYQLETFRSPDFGPIGMVEANRVIFGRMPAYRRHIGWPEAYGVGGTVPRVDICYSHAGADGVGIRAFVAAGARGLISAGMLPGMCTPAENVALDEAVTRGVVVVQATSGYCGGVVQRQELCQRGILAAGHMRPRQARILLALALMTGMDRDGMQALFDMP